MSINRISNYPYLGLDGTVYDDILLDSKIAIEERRMELMDSNLYTEILDDQYDQWKYRQNKLDLSARFKKECEEIPYLQQCKLYDC